MSCYFYFDMTTIAALKSYVFWDKTPSTPLNINGLQSAISQKTEPFLTIAMSA